jgi:hypothetical protein
MKFICPQCPQDEQDPPEQLPQPHDEVVDDDFDWPCAKKVESSLLESSLWHFVHSIGSSAN